MIDQVTGYNYAYDSEPEPDCVCDEERYCSACHPELFPTNFTPQPPALPRMAMYAQDELWIDAAIADRLMARRAA